MNPEDAAYIERVKDVAQKLIAQSQERNYGPDGDGLPHTMVHSLDSLGVDIEALSLCLPPKWRIDVHTVGSWQRKPTDPPIDPQYDIAFARFKPSRDTETT